MLHKPKNFGRLAKWAIELGEHDIRYRPGPAMKGQIIADFIAESPNKNHPKILEETTTSLTQNPEKTPLWTLYIDGASSNEGSGAGLILTDPDGKEITYALRFEFPASNNEAEYEALIAGLELAVKMEVCHLQVFSNSLLMTNHLKGTYEAREKSMKRYLAKVLSLQENFKSFLITQVPRLKNKRANALSKLASSSFTHLTKNVLVEVVPCQSTEAATINVVTESEVAWMNPIVEYLRDGRLPDDPIAARKIRIKAPQYSLKQATVYLSSTPPSKIEVTNRTLLQGLKTRLGKSKGQWVEELSNVLWEYRMTAKADNNCTPFSLVYGSEAVLPPEIGIPTYRISSYEESKNNEELRLNLELLEERKEMAALCEAKYKRQTEQYYNQKARHQQIKVGDHVLQKNEASRQQGQKKLDPN
ncbi:reverse transcriptase domain-containing protein [Tanacetum coccineum]|uniref:Reverse transcriptase domain-containing protein n=1 Tax=Tanacetum coccineum TaxID=301880 RepID=A0ABQ5AZ66_9ASTR